MKQETNEQQQQQQQQCNREDRLKLMMKDYRVLYIILQS